MQYGALSRARNIIWRNKVMVFAGLAALGSGSGGGGKRRRLSHEFTCHLLGKAKATCRLTCSARLRPAFQPGAHPDHHHRHFPCRAGDRAVDCLISALGHGAMVRWYARRRDRAHPLATGWTRACGGCRCFDSLPAGTPPAILIIAVDSVVDLLPLLAQPGMRDAERLFAGGVLTWLFACFALPAASACC
jgi:hypothetical protein